MSPWRLECPGMTSFSPRDGRFFYVDSTSCVIKLRLKKILNMICSFINYCLFLEYEVSELAPWVDLTTN